MAQLPTGAVLSLASTFAASKTTTIVTNASEAVVTSTAHGYSNGDYVEMTSGWSQTNRRVFRIKSVTTDTFVLEGHDTSSTTLFPAGSGTGSVRKITAWTQISKVLSLSPSGGDPKPVTYKFVESDIEYSINDGFTAQQINLEIDDDTTTAGYTALKTFTDSQGDTALRIVLKNGNITLLACTVALNETPIMQDGQINRLRVAINGNNRVVRYAS